MKYFFSPVSRFRARISRCCGSGSSSSATFTTFTCQTEAEPVCWEKRNDRAARRRTPGRENTVAALQGVRQRPGRQEKFVGTSPT
jgi:hypothetical protein